MKKIILKIKGMHCNSCASLIEGALEDIGVKANVNFVTEKAEIEFDEKKTNEFEIVKIINKAGYEIKK